MTDSDTDSTFTGFQLYRYTPSASEAGLFAMLFFTSSIFQAWKNFRSRSWYFSAMIVGGLMEGAGYIARVLSHNNPEALGPYIVQSILLLVAPALYAAAIHIVLGRLMRKVHGEQFSLIRINWLTKIFVTGDILSFLIQSSGGGLLASAKSQSSVSLGQNIIIVGLVVQILWFGGFIFVAVVFHYRMRVMPTIVERKSWRSFMYVLYAASTMIMVRSVFRVIEFAQGNDGYLMRSEIWLYVFDSVLMAGVITLFNIHHPSKYLRKDGEYRMGWNREEHATIAQHYLDEREHIYA
ncbi:RTA1-domain-containing protein [Guyanagaster necrorhizus]|uniref:RTA1-domain-containing protein n=1 Tax=Guyanagaster necrorhizus TaxID=856835 RepID=A0A9P7W3V5_9AGAR|nr:RTA1-domain-containing protein [Guyanagaster necrorhizus MCA 3950]KAG7452926.1 RTA1-domain-containing protein [Guyanagaster necrorhizus MCA 3950]